MTRCKPHSVAVPQHMPAAPADLNLNAQDNTAAQVAGCTTTQLQLHRTSTVHGILPCPMLCWPGPTVVPLLVTLQFIAVLLILQITLLVIAVPVTLQVPPGQHPF